MKTHRLKTGLDPFKATLSGEKTHEVREDDRGFEKGDRLLLEEWDPSLEVFTGRSIQVLVTYVTRGYGLPDNLCVMSVSRERLLKELREAKAAPTLVGGPKRSG